MTVIDFQNKPVGWRMLELGGGDSPHPNTDVNVDCRQGDKVHFTANFEQPLPIADCDFEIVYSAYCMEHLPYHKVAAFLQEVFRVTKPDGRVVFLLPNTLEQFEWIRKNPGGWDGKELFTAASELIYGTQDYNENAHRCFFTPQLAINLFASVGFHDVQCVPYNERRTDMCIQARKPAQVQVKQMAEAAPPMVLQPHAIVAGGQENTGQLMTKGTSTFVPPSLPPEQMFDRHYFNGGSKVGGYAREGLWDFPVHQVTFLKVMERKPESVLELGCARGYIGKRIEDAGIPYWGVEVSKHCYLTRACDRIGQGDICRPPWPMLCAPGANTIMASPRNDGKGYDLCFSIAVLEHVPEAVLPAVIQEMTRTCRRGLHGIDFGLHDDGFDKTHVTLRPQAWWMHLFQTHAPGWPVEIVDKEELERGELPAEYLNGDGKLKLNVGCFTTQFHNGWTNIDVLDVNGFAQAHRYRFTQLDVRNGLPYGTGVVDAIFSAHFLEHLTYDEGVKFLRECRRVIRRDGAMRLLVPDAGLLMGWYIKSLGCLDEGSHFEKDICRGSLADFSEINDGCAAAPTAAGKLWALLHEGHASCYDEETLCQALTAAGFVPMVADFRLSGLRQHRPATEMQMQILRETIDMQPSLSLIVDAVPT